MGIIECKCKLITPMLIHGENTNIAELRPPAIKGSMRFWWRAIHGNLELTQLKEQESRLFGGAGDGNAVRSSFRIKLQNKYLKIKEANPLPHKPKNRDGSPKFTISSYEENQNFTVEFIGHEVDNIRRIFELTTILGGFGQRSRRGFGSVQIDNQENITVEYIQALIQQINPNYNNESDINYPYLKEVEIGRDYNNIDDLIRTISSATHHHNGDGMFGSVRGGRYASPIYISVIKNGQNYQPIITTLNATKRIDSNRLDEFKGAIL